jgi:Mrp family chromosome partitioning ATPase
VSAADARDPTTSPPVGGGVLALRAGTDIVPVRLPDPAVAAGYVRLASHLLLLAKSTPFRSVGVISPHAGDGKTTTALNLAACLGRAVGRVGRVLLVDGDSRNRTLSHLLSRETGDGGGRVANGKPNGRARAPRLRLTDFPGVDLMTAPGPSDEFRLCSPEMWTNLLGSLPERYSTLVVDCPSVLDRSDGLVLPACVEQLVLVVRAGVTTKRAVGHTIEAVGRSVAGVVVNAVRRN